MIMVSGGIYVDKHLCEAKQPVAIFGVPGWELCCDPAPELWRYLCEHGHAVEAWTCLPHRPAPGKVGCRRCRDAGHDCDMTAVRVNVG